MKSGSCDDSGQKTDESSDHETDMKHVVSEIVAWRGRR